MTCGCVACPEVQHLTNSSLSLSLLTADFRHNITVQQEHGTAILSQPGSPSITRLRAIARKYSLTARMITERGPPASAPTALLVSLMGDGHGAETGLGLHFYDVRKRVFKLLGRH